MVDTNSIVVDTRPESGSPFVAPDGISDYVIWLMERYNQCRVQDGESHYYFGLGQKINTYIFMAKRKGSLLMTKGPHASDAARAIEKIADHAVVVETVQPY